MADNIADIKSFQKKDVVELLKNLLTMAENGEIKYVVYFGEHNNSDSFAGCSSGYDKQSLLKSIGELRVLESQLISICEPIFGIESE